MISKVFKSGNSLALRLPRELEPKEGEVHIEAVGDRWIVSPIKAAAWPKGFFSRIRISEPASFKRPPQGRLRDIRLGRICLPPRF
jgi:virulence-associated protein VagC